MTEEKWDWKKASQRYAKMITNYGEMAEEIKQLKRQNTMLQQKVERYEEVLLEVRQSTKKIRKTRSKPKPVKKGKETPAELSKALNTPLPEG